MKKHCIDLRQTGQFSSFFLDYIEGKDALRPFYSHLPKLESFRDAIAAKSFSSQAREVLVESLLRQYEGMELSPKAQSNLESLDAANTFTVTTGHQLNLFTGPLYFIYKIVSTIKLASALKEAYPEYNFVPVYWMASEDHDFDEINYFKLDGKKFQWTSQQTGAVGDFDLDQGFKDFLKTVPFAHEVFKKAYSSSGKLSEAVRKYVDGLFGEEGLVIIDGNDSALKAQFSKVMLEDLFVHSPFVEATVKTEALESLGYSGQIFPREINFFYLDKGVRERIEQHGDRYVVLNTELSFSSEEIKDKIRTNPEQFSPNVVLRPLYQEMILPNLAYLGGPAEVVYWLQLKGVFDHFQVPFPVLLPRNFALVLSGEMQRKIEKMGWGPADLFQNFKVWAREFVEANAKLDISLEKERIEIVEIFDKKGEEAADLEKSLMNSFEAAKIRSLKILDQMSRKLRKAEERRQYIQLERVSAIEDYLKPGGSPQERVVNMMQFYLANPNFIHDLMEVFDPLDFRMMVLEE
ncbi:bacillithiol biosynthesis cysteine-adding enzyme BshC [Algoriphagus sp. CAU 1675]|uniref:bacillithiol biosynthesis cysteine-adding enzyme BshC n=1 Tax=Algoriphagus sp. CAU 1675 TaxID=3032597 RepID=UPI0023DC6EB1|nr:bacillithiol biosynthesis cysteine-adding enzyme BshC [Algoriphagus sp. CAU 1675]MDF2156868.1 bacillithiol biosynthesis cysteine-adding enzyme BshC [Algoriphagus sp. CAU 1675]